MRQWRRAVSVAVIAAALQAWACGTDIAPIIETERRFQGTAQLPPPQPAQPFDMSLFLRRLASGLHGVTGGFDVGNGQVRGSVVGTLTGTLDDGQFSGRLIAAENQRLQALSVPPGARGNGGVFALTFMPPAVLMLALQDLEVGCVVEQQYTGTVSLNGIEWVPGDVINGCPTNPLNFTLTGAPISQEGTTSVTSTSTTPTTSTTSTTSTSTTSTTSTSTTSTTTTTTTIPTTTSTTTTSTIRPLSQP